MNGFLARAFPWLVLALCVGMVGSRWATQRPDPDASLAAFAAIPVSSEGRAKPLDTVARSALMVMGGRQTPGDGGKDATAIHWLADLMADGVGASDRQVFRIDHPDLRSVLHLPADERRRFTFREIAPNLETVSHQADLAMGVSAKQRDPYQRQVVDLMQRVELYGQLAQLDTPYVIPPLELGGEWKQAATVAGPQGAGQNPALDAWRKMLSAWHDKDGARFAVEVAAYRGMLDARLPETTQRARVEVFFNGAEPFLEASSLYVLGLVLALFGVVVKSLGGGAWPRAISRATLMALLVAFALHTIGIVSRVYLQGRPPVTNLYSSAVFIGWVAVVLGVMLERSLPVSLGYITAATVGTATQIIAHNLAASGDTMQMMQAVLDTNFWLATHVIVVTIGYSATFFAGLLGISYILLGVFTPLLRGGLVKSVPKTIYGVICFAAFASFLGTVLGGIWADQSWGRFWGWDPKENGAALIVLMNLIGMHARWAGLAKERGIAMLAVTGNIVTAWSWFGTNMLGVGLHSYGFMDSAAAWLIGFIGVQLMVIGIGLIPQRRWRSVRPPARAVDTENSSRGARAALGGGA